MNEFKNKLEEFLQIAKDTSAQNSPWIEPNAFEEEFKSLFEKQRTVLSEKMFLRLHDELFGWGPLTSYIENSKVSEIMINQIDQIWIEVNGSLEKIDDQFLSYYSFERFINRLTALTGKFLNLENPFLDGQIDSFRVHIASTINSTVHRITPIITLRRQAKEVWTLQKLQDEGWAAEREINLIREWIKGRKNILVVGGTSSGKTSVLNSMLNEIPQNQRVILIEDTLELKLPNTSSVRLVTRGETGSSLKQIDQSELLRQSLRMRPDRVVVGEVRGGEAKDLLMALSTGHAGSLGTLHACSPHQALFRFETLVQIGAPQWPTAVVRKLVSMGLDCIITVERNSNGQRILKGLHEIASLEDSGILLEPHFELAHL